MKMKASQLQPIGKNILLFFEDSEMNDKIKLAGGIELFMVTKWVPTENVKDSAVAYNVGGKTKIPKGATVYVDYLVHSQDNNPPIIADEEGVYFQADENDVYLWENNGDKETIGKWIVVEVLEPEEEYTGPIVLIKGPKEEKLGRVVFSNKEIEKNLGVKVGDTVILDERYNYEFKYKGDSLYRVDSNIGLLAIKK